MSTFSKKLKKLTLSAFLMLVLGAKLSSTVYNYQPSFELNPLYDGIELGLGAVTAGSAFIFDKFFPFKSSTLDPKVLDKEKIPDMDLFFAGPYNKTLHYIGTGTAFLALFTPAMFAILPDTEWLTIGVMYAETLLFAYGIKEWIKLGVFRARPYMYFDGYPKDKVEDGDWNCSFPSGHTTYAFAGAAFTTLLFCQYFPESKWKYAVAGTSFGIAAITGALRMASGNHFYTDVLCGAVIGTACGLIIPTLHTKTYYEKHLGRNKSARVSVMPDGLNVSFAL